MGGGKKKGREQRECTKRKQVFGVGSILGREQEIRGCATLTSLEKRRKNYSEKEAVQKGGDRRETWSNRAPVAMSKQSTDMTRGMTQKTPLNVR